MGGLTVPTLRVRLYEQLAPEGWTQSGLSPTNKLVLALIISASAVAIVETEAALSQRYDALFTRLEVVFVTAFAVEYIARLYAAGEDKRFAGVTGRLRYLCTWWAIVDLLAILPFILSAGTYNTFLLRLLKLSRLLCLSRPGLFSRAWQVLGPALRARSHEPLLSVGAAGLLLFSAACLYVEAPYQPDAFGGIPRSLWWSIATLTTVGYGDVTLIIVVGKLLAGLTAIAGIGLIAMPTGIHAAAFSDAFQHTDQKTSDTTSSEET